MHRLFRHALALIALASITACNSTDAEEMGYKVLVLDEAGKVIENASITPRVEGHSFKPKFTELDGMVDLNDVYSQKPTSIVVRAIGYKTRVVAWSLPDTKPLTVVLSALSPQDE